MLNISKYPVSHKNHSFSSYKRVALPRLVKGLTYWIIGLFGFAFIMLFMPWTQNISATGNVIALYPEQRPQSIESAIAGRIEKWYVREGEYVHKNDTILFLSEIKDEYFDPQLVKRTIEQITAKELALTSYQEKVNAIENQIEAINKSLVLKLQQAENYIITNKLKVQADSLAYAAVEVNFKIAENQLNRQEKLYEQGLKSLTELEQRRTNFQQLQAQNLASRNTWLASKNELINAQLAYNNLQAEFTDKLAKAQSEKFSAQSQFYYNQEELAKLKNKLTNIQQRVDFRFITAPQDGFITKAIARGIGETIKEGEEVITIVPGNRDLAVELYVRPIDLPLISLGENVRLQFDGWPAIVFSGWPNVSFGTFGAQVVAIDNVTSQTGKYRIIVAPSEPEKPWPVLLRVGSGARGFALLKTVPVWYELWRQFNGFPPDFYIGNEEHNVPITRKKGLEKI